MATLNTGLTVMLNGRRIMSRDGLSDLLSDRMDYEPLYPIIHLRGEDIEIAFTHTRGGEIQMIHNEVLQSFASVNTVSLLILALLLYFLRANWRYEVKQTAQFMPPTLFLMVLIVLDNLDYYAFTGLEHTGLVAFLHRAVSMLAFDSRLLCMAFLLSIVSVRIGKTRRTKFYTITPAIINCVIMLPSLFTDWFAYHDIEGHLQRGIFFYEPHILFILYFNFLMYMAYTCWHTYNRKTEAGILIMLGAVVFVSVAVELLFALKGILIGAVSLSILGYYLYVHVEHFRFDNLTQIPNRDAFKVDTERTYSKLEITHVLSIDLNNLKVINDTFGHNEGDKALITVAQVLEEVKHSNCKVYRIGGDEFAAICIKMTSEDVESMIQTMYDTVKKSGYSVAIGYSEWTPDKTFKEVYKDADDNMYRQKRKIKGIDLEPII